MACHFKARGKKSVGTKAVRLSESYKPCCAMGPLIWLFDLCWHLAQYASVHVLKTEIKVYFSNEHANTMRLVTQTAQTKGTIILERVSRF